MDNGRIAQKKREYALDKDIKIKGNKIYSKDSCIFTLFCVNSADSCKRTKITGLTYLGIRLSDNYQEEFTNQSEFARKYDLYLSTVNKCLKGKQKVTGGWKFQIKNQSLKFSHRF